MTATSPAQLSKAGFARWIRQRAKARKPAAVVRFGDAEARLLLAEPGDRESMTDAATKLKRETGREFSPEDVLELKASVSTAFEGADVLGIGVIGRGTRERRLWMGRLAALYQESVAAGRPPAALAHCMLSQDIVGDLPGLLASRRLSVISCRNLKPLLEGEWQAEDVRVHQVPSQHGARDVDGAYEASMHDVAIWPGAIARVRSELAVRETGEVFLVGAGVFSKGLCIEIRDRGGIALDMGSVLDRIAGKLTRGPKRRVVEMRANGMSVEEIAARMSETFGIEVESEAVSSMIDEVEKNIVARRRWLARDVTP